MDGVSCSSGPAAGEPVDAAQTLAQLLVKVEALISPCYSSATEAPIRERAHAHFSSFFFVLEHINTLNVNALGLI